MTNYYLYTMLCLQYPTVCYDPQYALRLCMEHKLDEPCVHIYAAMGLYEESVELALKVRGREKEGGRERERMVTFYHS